MAAVPEHQRVPLYQSAPLHESAAWQALEAHRVELAPRHLRHMFAADPQRGQRMVLEAAGVLFDHSKHKLTDRTLELLVALARERGLDERRAALFAGERVNLTEDRPALHVALRLPREASLVVDGHDVVADVHSVLDRMAAFARSVRDGQWRGVTGRRVRTVINVGIGGSDLGPAMAYRALAPFVADGLACRFVSNVDGAEVAEAMAGADPAETLVIVSSKTFTTTETLTNATTLRNWITGALGEEAVSSHMVAVSSAPDRARQFGIDVESVFGFWDWVGGRYSMTSAIGLATMLAIGPEAFAELLAGAHAMDEHFRTAPLEVNLPARHGLVWFWCMAALGAGAVAVVPYDRRLSRFPAYLQQLVMESNGKGVTTGGDPVPGPAAPVIFGEPGTNAQHSFHQLLHQGTAPVPVDFVAVARPAPARGAAPVSDADLAHHRDLLLANLLAQAEALAFGRTAEELRAEGTPEALVPHKVMPGDRPSSVLLVDELTPRTLGALVALFEHSVFTQAVLWDIDPFDQWGVELGKVLAGRIHDELTAVEEPVLAHDSSTNALLTRLRGLRRTELDHPLRP